jgi:GABA(A) receptor-associated protein
MSKYCETRTFDERKIASSRILTKYPDRIPVIVDRADGSEKTNKFLVPYDLTVGQFFYILRRKIGLESSQTLFLFFNNTLPQTSRLISDIYAELKAEDGFLYCRYQTESTFGSERL